jgi:hypothetical protein
VAIFDPLVDVVLEEVAFELEGVVLPLRRVDTGLVLIWRGDCDGRKGRVRVEVVVEAEASKADGTMRFAGPDKKLVGRLDSNGLRAPIVVRGRLADSTCNLNSPLDS